MTQRTTTRPSARLRMALLLTLAALVATVTACSDDDDSSTATTEPEVVIDEEAEGPGDTEPPALAMEVATTPLGEIVVDGEGMTLYALTNDPENTSTCVDACADAWPPFTADAVEPAAALDINLFAQYERDDGSMQIVFNGHPLYYFSGDAAPGETNGQGVNDVWFVVGVDGELITTAP